MKIIILTIPSIPNSLKLIAQGYRKITSISNKTNKIATRKYFTEKGFLALPIDLIPHSKFLSLLSEDRLGPSFEETNMVPTTNPTAKTNCIKIGI